MVDRAEEVSDVGLHDMNGVPARERHPDRLQRLRSPTASGRNPYDTGRKSASKIGSSTSLAACCTTRSRTVGIPSGRLPPSGFGISTRRTGAGRYVPARRSRGKLAEHPLDAVLLHRGQGHPIHPGRTPVRSHPLPRLPQDVTPLDPVIQGVETPPRRLLGRSP